MDLGLILSHGSLLTTREAEDSVLHHIHPSLHLKENLLRLKLKSFLAQLLQSAALNCLYGE